MAKGVAKGTAVLGLAVPLAIAGVATTVGIATTVAVTAAVVPAAVLGVPAMAFEPIRCALKHKHNVLGEVITGGFTIAQYIAYASLFTGLRFAHQPDISRWGR